MAIKANPGSRKPSLDDLLAQFNPKNPSTYTDAGSIRREFGLPRYRGEQHYKWPIVPDLLEHTWEASETQTAGGTDALVPAKPGSGKSTLALGLATHLMDINQEKVVWRASSSRSEWLPLAPWTTLCLPEDLEVKASFEPRIPKHPEIPIPTDRLDEVVREVRRYSDPMDLNQNVLEPGQFHAVYPDPLMRGCQDVYEADPEKNYEAPQGGDRPLFAAEDPANHWWFGWILSRIVDGPHDWTTLVLDEIGDIAPQSASKDGFGTYQKIQLLKDAWVDARKKGLSLFLFGHSEVDIHQLVRHKIRWRITLAGQANPTSPSGVVGAESVPMRSDLTSKFSIGEGLVWNEVNFDQLTWSDFPTPINYKLKVVIRG